MDLWQLQIFCKVVELEIFSRAFCLRNGFHCNGDQSGKGYSRFTYRPFTLEGDRLVISGAPGVDPATGEGVIYRMEFRKV